MSRISSPAPLSERASPYQGLTPFTPEDTPYFFGREQDTEIITANLIAERLTLLYGPSGVGKSSVLGAGVVHNLRERAQRESARGDPPEYLVVFFNDWRNEPVAALTQEIEKQLRAFAPPPPAETTLAAALRAWSEQTGAELLFIFDQFEEYFLYHENDKGDETFAAQFANVLKDADGRANFLLSFREDALAKMDFFKKRIPNLFKNYLRIKHLDDDAARRAILKPLEKYNADHPAAPPVTMEPALVEEILREVQVGRVTLGESGRGAVMQENRAAIETPFLQLVLTRLWTYERAQGSNTLRLASFTALGGAEKIVRGHLQNAIETLSPREQGIAASVFDRLVTPSGAKIAQNAPDLARYARVPESELKNVLERLSGGQNRILRPVAPALDLPDVPRYEIFHDVLGAALLEWKRGYENKRRLRRIAALAVASGALVLVFGLLALFAVRSQAKAQTAKAEANSKAQQAETSAAAAIKSEARAVAESTSAAKSAQEADTAKNAAVASANESRARLHLAEGNQAFVKNPLLGMRLALEGLALTAQQPGAQTEKMTDEAATLLKQGKFVRLGSNATGFFPNPDKTMLVVQNADAPGEVRRWRDGALVAQLAGKVNWVDSSPAPAETFVVRYEDAPGEVRRWRDGALVETLADKVYGVYSSPAPAETFVVSYYDVPSEVRRWRDGALVETLAGKVNDVTSSPEPAETFVVAYADASGEVWRWRDGALVETLAGKVVQDGVISSPDPAGAAFGPRFADSGERSFVVVYTDAPSELRRWSDGGLIAKLAGKLDTKYGSPVLYSPDAPPGAFVASYSDAPWDVRRASDGAVLVVLGSGVAETIFDSTGQRLAVRYSDRRAYLLDLYFLNAYGTADTPHSFQELEWLACTYLFEPYQFDEGELKEYLEEEESRVCR
ncbi:MAG: hypothetical protein BroJett039_11780 [Chloroflexota bacterium]|nr:MAG: hypothetical protein BroJett039_11780 [Chloroflexota bacterium]